jgi:hypothetical protein
LFEVPPRDFALIVISPEDGSPLVAKYRNREQLLAAIPHSNRLNGLPEFPFIGEARFRDLTAILRCNCRFMSPPERKIINDLCTYLTYKEFEAYQSAYRQKEFPLMTHSKAVFE